jgi:hypothetical protein
MSSLLAKNVGTVDRVARIALGLGLLSLTIVGPQTAWGYVGVVPLLTAFIGSCPLYSLFGFSTCPVQRA